ncbi:MAG: L-serine ammonia-lyase, iron-sulfur-dependent, subunit beta, partial [Peptoniphilaceae bacterium]|nr:L-serine ammonia-lyase, iron-sulfur-dependent, subunit beta [Peptoniphilaceae bacterium]
LLVLHRDVPGVIADVTNMLRDKYDTLNIAGFRLSRKEKGKDAIMTIEFDENPPDSLKSDLETLPHILNTILIRAI